MNSLYNTLNWCLEKNGKSIDDIIWVGCTEYQIPLSKFINISKNTQDVDYGEYGDVPCDLIVVGKDFWLEREVDSRLGPWLFKKYPKMPNQIKNVTKLSSRDFTNSDYKILDNLEKKLNLDAGYSQMWMLPHIK